MFKYLWILIPGLLAATFITYTVYAVKDCLENHVIADWTEFLEIFDDEHDLLLTLWGGIIFVTTSILVICTAILVICSAIAFFTPK